MALTHAHRGPTAQKTSATKKTTSKAKTIGQRTIDDERAAQLQGALAKAGYLTSQPSGHWDATTEAAMSRLQADNGWQTKFVPDSRAIIKLGLGPATNSPLPSNETSSLTTGSGLVAAR